jgi:hypothetical protein
MNTETNPSQNSPLLSYVEQQEAQLASTKLAAASLKELATTFALDPNHARHVFRPACIRRGVPGYPSLYDRAVVCELLETWNGRDLGYPLWPLIRQKRALRMLAELGTPRSSVTLWRLAKQGLITPVRINTALRYSPAEIEGVSNSLQRWSRV